MKTKQKKIDMDKLKRAINDLDSCVHMLSMPGLKASIHVEGLRGSLPRILAELREATNYEGV